MTSELPFIVKWSEEVGQDRVNWFVRSVAPSKFFGEVTVFSARLQTTIEGAFSDVDWETMRRLVIDIRRHVSDCATATNRDDWRGLLALGSLAKPEIILNYYKGSETSDEAARLFLDLVSILRRYVQSEKQEKGTP